MDIDFRGGVPPSVRDEIRKEHGMEDGPAAFDQAKMEALLERPEVEDVRVFKQRPKRALKKGQVIVIEGHFYRVAKTNNKKGMVLLERGGA